MDLGNLLKKYTIGSKIHNFRSNKEDLNIFDSNFKVKLPILSIHGNHDYPTGVDVLSTLDIFSLIQMNYFGKVTDLENFTVRPIILMKGTTKIALYGIGFIKDDKLTHIIEKGKLRFEPPSGPDCFCILVVHQNRRAKTTITSSNINYLDEKLIPPFINLVVWGHEHESFTDAFREGSTGAFIYQPGSTMITSLIEAESKPKYIGVLEVNQTDFRINPIKLSSARPFVFEKVCF